MDDFSIKPGVPNMYGALGNDKNAITPGKRMLSSMTPTIVLKGGSPYLVVGVLPRWYNHPHQRFSNPGQYPGI